MAACGSLRPLFENPIPDKNPTLIESLSSWKTQIKPTIEPSSFTEIFGELHFKEKPTPQENSSSSSPEKKKRTAVEQQQSSTSMDSLLGRSNQGRGFPSLDSLLVVPPKSCSESLQLCTEGLGFESSDDVEDSKNESGRNWEGIGEKEEKGNGFCRSWSDGRLSTRIGGNGGGGMFPPPISCLGGGGKPWIWFKSYKGDGRFVLREIRIPTKEFLHASREDGRLKLHLVQPDDDAIDGDEAEEAVDEEQEEEEEEEQEEEQRKQNGV